MRAESAGRHLGKQPGANVTREFINPSGSGTYTWTFDNGLGTVQGQDALSQGEGYDWTYNVTGRNRRSGGKC